MLKSIQQRDLDRNRWIKITMAVILGLIIISMVVTLVPGLVGGLSDTGNPSDTIASIGGESLTVVDFQRQFNQLQRRQSMPPMMKNFYAKQLMDDMIFQHALAYEAAHLGIQVTPDELRGRIKEILPGAFSGNTWLKDRYTTEVETQTGMAVEEFERYLQDQMLVEKFYDLVTGGISVSPAEIEQEFHWQNDKAKIEFALIKPADLAPGIHPTDAELSAWFATNASRYQIPEKRSARYALLDLAKLRAGIQVDDNALRAYYNSHIDDYRVQNRVHAEHILFKTVGKTDAETAEIRQKAEDALKQANKGSNFEDLAKKYSEDDGSKTKGGDLGWIVEGQTVPEFQQAAFGLPKGSISDLVKTQYGFHIIKVLDHETAHTKSFEEVRDSIRQPVVEQKASAEANDIATQMAAAVRQSDRQPLDDLAKKFHLDLGETPAVAATDPLGPLGAAPDLQQTLFSLRTGELSAPAQIESGYVILTAKEIFPAHAGTLAEVHDRVLADYQQEKSVDLARSRAEELSKRVAGGEALDKAAKSLGIALKTSDPFSRTGSLPDVGAAKQLEDAFTLPVGQFSKPTQSGGNWLVYRVLSRDTANPDDLAKQKDAIQQQLLQTKQNAAFTAFHAGLIDGLKKQGKMTINTEAMSRATRTI